MTPYFRDEWLTVYGGDCRAVLREMEPESAHCVVTSPPYWGLRDYGTPGQLGLEATPEEYVAALVDVFREVRRVLRDDGTVWLNLGDSYAGSPVGTFNGGGFKDGSAQSGGRDMSGVATSGTLDKLKGSGLKPKDLVGIPWRVAFALQADGWYLRSDIIWSKPNPMPESVTDRPTKSHEMIFLLAKSPRYFFDADAVREGIGEAGVVEGSNGYGEPLVFGQDFGLESQSAYSNAVGVRLATAILESAGRQHEFGLSALDAEVGQESRQDGAGARTVSDPIMRRAAAEATRFADGDIAAKEFLREVDRLCIALTDGHDLKELRTSGATAPLVNADGDAAIAIDDASEVGQLQLIHDEKYTVQDTHRSGLTGGAYSPPGQSPHSNARGAGRNLRSVWTIATAPYPGAHFATFPPKLVEPCVKAGTSERGVCPECGAPWVRVTNRAEPPPVEPSALDRFGTGDAGVHRKVGGQYQKWLDANPTATTGWRPGCAHDAEPVPATVLDPFAGTGTVGLVAAALSRRAVLIDLNPDYLRQCLERNRQTPLGLPA